jgi:uncharacterized protein (DUF433 family)/DNA-binding transcriptional MerR regulator
MPMVALSPMSAFVGIGLYSVADAAQLLKESPRNIRRWLGGYSYKHHGEKLEVPPLWQSDLVLGDDRLELSFRDLIELRFVKAFLDAGIGLKAIRNCLSYACECVDNARPFSSGKFRTDGRSIFLESLEKSSDSKLLDLKRKQYVFKQVVDRSFKDLDLEDDLVARWRPYKGRASIVIDPARSFGQPIVSKAGVPTVALADAVEAEGSEARVARLFDVTEAAVRDAVRFQRELEGA